MKKFSGFFAIIGILCFFLWSTFYLLQERKNSWQIVITQLAKEKLVKSVQGFQASKKYKKYLVSIFAKTAMEYEKKEDSRWVLKDIILTIKVFSNSMALSSKTFILKSRSAVFDQKIELLSFTDIVYMDFSQYTMEVKGLKYDLKANKLFSYKGALIKNSFFNIVSKGLKLSLNPLYLTLFLGTQLKFKNNLLGSGIKAEGLSYNFKDYFIFKKQVKIFHKAYNSFSDQLIFNNSKEHLQYILKGNVLISIGGHNFRGDLVLFDPIDQSIEIKKGKIQIDESLNF